MKTISIITIILAVHSSGIITGSFMNNGAVRCGIFVCRPISAVFTKNPLPNGYVHITTIPVGASNITITELKNSINYLVLKRADQNFILNGDHTVSDSDKYSAAGTVFDYHRLNRNNSDGVTEWITSTGPTSEPVYLMVLNQDTNPGIKYEYLLPVNSIHNGGNSDESESDELEPSTNDDVEVMDSKHTLKSAIITADTSSNAANERRKKKLIWKVIGFNQCSKSCGGGTQAPVIRCVREAPTKYFAQKRCAHLPKPVLSESILRCNTQPCPSFWKIDDWSPCNCGKSNEQEYQHRHIECVQELGTGTVIQVNNGACLEQMPPVRTSCKCKPSSLQTKTEKQPSGHHRHRSNGDKAHKHRMGAGNFRPPVTIIGESPVAKKSHVVVDTRKPGIWLSSDWSQQCSTTCGDGVQYRSIFCDRSVPNLDRCDLRLTPDTTRQCSANSHCDIGNWFVGPWSQCSGDCFNLIRTRSVICVKNGEIVPDSFCINSNEVNIKDSAKPTAMEKCKTTDVDYCKARWHYSEWTECSRSCDGGNQRRTIKCFEPNLGDLQIKESEHCKYSERLPGFRSCNEQKCESSEISSSPSSSLSSHKTTLSPRTDPKVDLVQNDITPDCEDKFPNCHLVIRAKLCTYDYYINHCCATCREALEINY